MNRLQLKLQEDKKLLSIYFTAGFPALEDTVSIIQELEKSGVDFIEIGLPFSDPLADGPVIQESSTIALNNGMTTSLLFKQLEDIRKTVSIPLLIMGYFNPILQYGVERFCNTCNDIGIDGLIIPDLPMEEYENLYRPFFEKNNLSNIFLITPQTSEARIAEIDNLTTSFIYLVSSASTTGKTSGFNSVQTFYFDRISKLPLKNPQIVGFGINNRETFLKATEKNKGAIIGSAFIKMLNNDGVKGINAFIKSIR